MHNWKLMGLTLVFVITAAVAMVGYSPSPCSIAQGSSLQPTISLRTTDASHGVLRGDTIRTRIAQSQCIDHNQTCTLNGTPCCLATDECKGPFPNTTCQSK